MTIEQHIEELRAELGACVDDRERTQIKQEMDAARATLAQQNIAIAASLDPPG